MWQTGPVVLTAALAFTLVGAVAVIDAGPHTLALKKGVAATGATVVDDVDVQGALSTVGACFDVECLAKVALLADADAVVYASPKDGGLDVVAVDSVPRIGRAHAEIADNDDDVAAAVAAALAARLEPTPPPPSEATTTTSATTPTTATTSAATTSATTPTTTTTATPTDAPSVAKAGPAGFSASGVGGAGLIGAGVVALAIGGVVVGFGIDSASRAEAAHFQDDAASIGGEANARFVVAGIAGILGTGAIAAGVSLFVVEPGA